MATTSTITTNILNNGLIIGITLIAFLVIKEVSGAEKSKNKKIQSFINVINITIVPLFIIFMMIVIYKAITVLSTL